MGEGRAVVVQPWTRREALLTDSEDGQGPREEAGTSKLTHRLLGVPAHKPW